VERNRDDSRPLRNQKYQISLRSNLARRGHSIHEEFSRAITFDLLIKQSQYTYTYTLAAVLSALKVFTLFSLWKEKDKQLNISYVLRRRKALNLITVQTNPKPSY
jgi:hypothetical protein